MSQYGIAQRTSNTTNANANWEIRSTSGNKPKILTCGLTQNAATAGVYGVGRPGAIGITPTSPQTVVDEGDGNAPTGLTTVAVAWGTGPTVPTNFNRRYSCAATIGVGFAENFPWGFSLPVSGSIVFWNLATTPVCDVYVTVDE